MYIERSITEKLKYLAGKFPVIYLMGPRQSGKSTLLKTVFPDYNYVSLEETDLRTFANTDPRGFLNVSGKKLIIDEAQYAPDLFSYIQTAVDAADEPGLYLLSGSQNFLMMESISQSLAGRVGILSLLPFSAPEMEKANLLSESTYMWLQRGQYPRSVVKEIAPRDFYPAYLKTYVERDVRKEIGVRNVDGFTAFLKACAMNTGTPVNLSSIGKVSGIDSRTVSAWLNVLEESYIIFRLRPYKNKVLERYLKAPKIYFYDTGLLCHLLSIKSPEELTAHSMRGLIFENGVIADYFKRRFNEGIDPTDNTYFWRDSDNREKEVDLIVENANSLDLYEIKSSQTGKDKFAANMFSFEKKIPNMDCSKTVIYDGAYELSINSARFINWRTFAR